MSVEELGAVYRAGGLPESMTVLDGAPRGRMLTAVGRMGRGVPANALRRFAGSRQFPWAGKSFASTGDETGTGINRVRLGGGKEWFPFDTFISESVIDGEPCIVLDYDKSENPWLIRQIHDEMREVSPGLFLGPAMAKTKSGPKLILWFSIDTN